MGRRRRVHDSNPEAETDSDYRTQPQSPRPPHSPLSKYALIFSGLLLLILFLYAKYRSYNKNHTKETLHRLNSKQQSSYQLLEPDENEYSVNVLMTGSSVTGMNYGFAEISQRHYHLAVQNYQNIDQEELQKQQLYLLLSCRLTSEAHYLPNQSNSALPLAMALPRQSIYLHHNLTSLLHHIPPNQIFDETTSTFDQDLLSALLPLMRLLDSLRERLSKSSSSSRGGNPLIHLNIYSTGFHASIIQYVLHVYLSWSSSLEALVESPIRVEVISTEGVPWSSHSIFETIVSSELESRQKKEVDEIMRWNKIKSIAGLERYLILGGKKKIKYL
jgi:hypothetical protein